MNLDVGDIVSFVYAIDSKGNETKKSGFIEHIHDDGVVIINYVDSVKRMCSCRRNVLSTPSNIVKVDIAKELNEI